MSYNHKEIEGKWQKYRAKNSCFNTLDDPNKEKFYALDMLPHLSRQGLHVGHPEGYTATDILSRMKRAQGYNVLHPVGWDALGLSAEQYALDTGNDLTEFTKKDVETLRRQINSLGFSYDWNREINTADPKYYKWTQWIFIKLYEKGLAYEAEVAVNWVPELGTVILNEEVTDGKSECSGYGVIRRPMCQWMLKITTYTDHLLEDLKLVDQPESIKDMQRNWIGRSEGVNVTFKIAGTEESLTVLTTRPDTLFGATHIVLAPELELVKKITTPEQTAAVEAYIKETSKKPDLNRTDLAKGRTGIFTGAYAISPVNGQEIPIWIGDYALTSYGTGVTMAVSAHDERDYESAKTFGIDILPVVAGGDITTEAYTGDGPHINSDFLNGSNKAEAITKMNEWLEESHIGEEEASYRLRDWSFSCQRYWGEPIPVIHWEDGTTTTAPELELPLRLSVTSDIYPSGIGESPLANIDEWVNAVDSETGMKGRCEMDTMPQWARSPWYYLRFIDPHNKNEIADFEKLKRWLPVDIYIGGVEHAVLYLLYARFWYKFLYDIGVVPIKEPFQKLYNQGMILGRNDGKMSKSRGNAVDPDDVVAKYGTDTLRLYEMFIGLLDASIAWSENGLGGSHKFLDRVWRLIADEEGKMCDRITTINDGRLTKIHHQTVKKVTEDMANLYFNTAISQSMVFVNEVDKADILPYEYMEGFVQLLTPIASYIGEELWQILGNEESLTYVPWPTYDKAALVEDEVEVVFQVSGKLRGKRNVACGLSKEELEQIAMDHGVVKEFIEGKTVRKVIAVSDKLVNIIVN